MDEFAKHLQSGFFKARLSLLGLDIKDTSAFFESLCASGGVEEEEFVNGCMQLKGYATSLELNTMLLKMQTVLTMQEKQAANHEYGMQRLTDRRPTHRPTTFTPSEWSG